MLDSVIIIIPTAHSFPLPLVYHVCTCMYLQEKEVQLQEAKKKQEELGQLARVKAKTDAQMRQVGTLCMLLDAEVRMMLMLTAVIITFKYTVG